LLFFLVSVYSNQVLLLASRDNFCGFEVPSGLCDYLHIAAVCHITNRGPV